MEIFTNENLVRRKTAPAAMSRTFTPLLRRTRFPSLRAKGELISEPQFSSALRHAISPARCSGNGHFEAHPLKMAILPM